MNAQQIINLIAADIANERLRGQVPVLIRLGEDVRDILRVAKAEAATGFAAGALGETVLGIPVDKDPAINPAGYTIDYEPRT
jgi:hypothetical protein